MSTIKGLAAGGMLGMTLGAGLMMSPRAKQMKRMLRSGMQAVRHVMDRMT